MEKSIAKKSLKKGVPVQHYLDIAEIKEDTVILKDGTLRAVLAVSSLNFALKSENEQNALISAYAQFLNALDYPLQIVIQSRKLNIDDYLARLKQAEKNQSNELLRIQITDYLSFIKELVELGEIMTKRFFLVIPYSPVSDKRKGFWTRLGEVLRPLTALSLSSERFERQRVELTRRAGHAQSGLSGIGLAARMLDTPALIELYYRVYNPDLAEIQTLQDVTKLQLEGV
ncbi:hypothetical protein HYW17_01565 [Candidatus Uhrbacteria bacterium]|nr:hypothetical protein [Candidatus Uhrbacteria bacterium]